MGAQNLRNNASHKMHKSRKKLWLEELNKRILLLEEEKYRIGLSHIENVLLPKECITSEGEDKYVFSSNHVFIQRNLSKMSSNLNYNIILAFNEETFNYFNLEDVRCPSLTKYIVNKIIPRILTNLKIEKRKNELALRLVQPTTEELEERNLRRIKNEDFRRINEVKRTSVIPGKINYKLKRTTTEKTNKYIQIKEQNEQKFKEKISFMNIHIKNIGQNRKPQIVSDEEQDVSDEEQNEVIEQNSGKSSPVQKVESPVLDSDSDNAVQDKQDISGEESEYSGGGDSEIDSDLVAYFRGKQ